MSDEGERRLEELIQHWTPAAKAKAMEELKKRTAGERRVWYCKSPGRLCDGRPHEGYDYPHARGTQWPPPGVSWDTWFIMSGRGWGKTRTGAEWVRSVTQKVGRIALIGRTGPDVRTTMVEGESGLEAVCLRAGISYEWMPSKKEFTFANGAVAFGFSAEEPASLRGPQFGAAWLDEPAHMDEIDDVWENLQYGLRIPGLPGGAKAICTSTPLPVDWVKKIIKEDGTYVTPGHSDENADNLDDSYKRRVIEARRGTRMGRQELAGELLEDTPGALWTTTLIVVIQWVPRPGDFDRIVVAIDPAGTNKRKSDLTGIVVIGKIANRYVVLEDVSGRYSPNEWALTADRVYQKWQADAIVAERNYGGDMVKTTIEGTKTRARVIVKTATRSKELRAEPAVALYERLRVEHAPGLEKLETEMTSWVPGKGESPNRIDALVWGLDELDGGGSESEMSVPTGSISGGTGSQQRSFAPTGARLHVATKIPTTLQLPPNFPIRRRPF